LSWLSVGWITVEAGVAIVAALIAGSVALPGFGLDSLIELISASIVIWRFSGSRHDSEPAERRAQQTMRPIHVHPGDARGPRGLGRRSLL
jgi:hypothetical protein